MGLLSFHLLNTGVLGELIGGRSPISCNEKTATPLVAPTISSAIAGNTQVALAWGAVAGATSYTIKYGTATGVYGSTRVAGNVTSYAVIGLTNGTRYYFAVTATNATGASANSLEKNAVPLSLLVAPTLNSVVGDNARAVLSWGDS